MDNKTKGIALVLLTAVVSGFSIFANSFAVRGFDSSVFTFSKNIVVAVLLFAIIMGFGQFRQLRSLTRKQWAQLATIGFVGGSIPFLLYFRGLQMTTGATSGFIHKTIFAYVAFFAIIFLKEKLTRGMLAGAALLLAGNYLVLRPNFAFSTGHLLVAAATVMWAAENTYAKHVLKGLSGNVVAFGRMFFGSAFILIFLAATGKTEMLLTMSAAQYGWVIFAAMLLLLYVTAFYNGLRSIKATTAACILTIGSPITTLLAWAFKSASVSPFELAGSVFIVAGVASVIWLAGRTAVKSEAGWTA